MKLYQGLIMTLVMTFSFILLPETGISESQGLKNTDKHYSFILNNSNDTHVVAENIEKIYPNIKLNVIEEIGIVTVDLTEVEDAQNKIEEIYHEIGSFVDGKGEMPDLMEPDNPIHIQKNQIENYSNLSIGTSTFTSQNMLALPELHSEYFAPFNWYLNDVTNNHKAFDFVNDSDHSTIALIDSGIDTDHPLLKSQINLELAKNYVDNSSNINDEQGHGTQVAGIIASISPNSEITPYKVLGTGSGESTWVIEAIVDAAKDGNDVINLSLGTYLSKTDEEDKLLIKAYDKAIKFAKKEGAIVVASVGNSSFDLDELKQTNEFHLPGGSHHLITVSSNGKEDKTTSYSNFGKEVDFSAPGGDLGPNFDFSEMIITTYPSGGPNTYLDQMIGIPQGFTLSMGTSLATPQVSAAAAMVISEYREIYNKELNINQVKKYLKNGSIDIGEKGKDIYFGEGKLNIYNSLKNIQKNK
ncbi:S8 family serine peptidase [Jeotgalibacillus terrae]|uniref:S8 family serine peptidase n=1 Tax=Jeotgalibacillus terrae TaxID=587735 RepID=A0ABW5ZK32_9BACL|nr:S8 family serine peptidase [Jeotgalibacillus terrae]MBM7580801.1 subtilisin family serine protease [Jeotgalibacillus terrae]